jgi:hypothetical protein
VTDERMELPDALAREIDRDLVAVRPILRFELRAALLALVALSCGALMVSVHGVRSDLPELQMATVVTVFLLRTAAGVGLLALAMREAVPAAGWTDRSRRIAFIIAVAALLVLPEGFARAIDLGGAARVAPLLCFPVVVLVSVPGFFVSMILLRRAWPLRPVMTAALAGLGTGMLASAAMFIACDNASAVHAWATHESAAIAVALLGGLAGWGIGVQRARRAL